MKKLLLLLLFIPLVSFGQEWKFVEQGGAENNKYQLYESNDGGIKKVRNDISDPLHTEKATFIWESYNNLNNNKILSKEIRNRNYRGNRYTLNWSFKGYLNQALELNSTYNKKLDGWSRQSYDDNKQVCYEYFFISGYEIYFNRNYKCQGTNVLMSFFKEAKTIEEFDLESMINVFLEDYLNNYLVVGFSGGEAASIPSIFEEFKNIFKIKATFVPLENDALALAYGFNDDKNIVLKVDPEKWAKASSAKRWYTLYHELGHDVLNFEHGQGGKMMFNFADRDYNWETFEKDRNYMFKKAIENAKKRNKLF